MASSHLNPISRTRVSAPFRRDVLGKFDLQLLRVVRDCIRENNLRVYEGFAWRVIRVSGMKDVLI